MDELYNRVRTQLDQSSRISRLLIAAFHGEAQSHGTRMVLAGISNDPSTREMLQAVGIQGLKTIDISVDLSAPGSTNSPYDTHPSPLSHRRYAETLLDCVRTLMNEAADTTLGRSGGS
jgi:hypothetical protein